MFLHGIVYSNLGFKVQNKTFNLQRFNRRGIVQKKKAFLQRSSLPYTQSRCLSLLCQRAYHNMVQQFTPRAQVLMFGSQKKHTAWLEFVVRMAVDFRTFSKQLLVNASFPQIWTNPTQLSCPQIQVYTKKTSEIFKPLLILRVLKTDIYVERLTQIV